MDKILLKSLLESLIFVAENPLKVGEMLQAIESLQKGESEEGDEENNSPVTEAQASEDAASQIENYASQEEDKISKSEIQELVLEMKDELEQNPARGILLVEVGGGWQFRTRPENSSIIRYFYQPKPTRLSKPGLETLSIVAYRQPITRAEVDEIRGVDSGGVLKTLLEKNLLRIVGKRDEPGKPMLYGTTPDFLELFQLNNLKELPNLKDYRELEAEFRKQSGEEGLVLENEQEDEADESSILDLASEDQLPPLDDEEEETLGALDESIKGVRSLEKEIFPSEKKEEKGKESEVSANPESSPTPNETPTPDA